MKTYLITGGAGFIGSNLARRLLELGHKVYSIDNLSTGSLKNIEELRIKYPNKFTHISKPVEEAEKEGLLAELIDMSDVIFHLAAVVGVKLVVKNPTKTLRTNSICTELILRHAAKKGKRLLITSSSEVYGKEAEEGGILREDSDLLIGSSDKSRWCYAISKLHDEHLALAYHKEKKLPVTIVRLFNTVGPRQTGAYGMVVPRFIETALRNEPIKVYGDGKQTRCFTYIDDVIEALIKLAETKEAVGQIYNIGSNEEISIYNLALKIKERLNSKSEIIFVPYEKAYGEGFEDMKRRFPDISKIKALIGWEPKTSLNEIIDKIAESLR